MPTRPLDRKELKSLGFEGFTTFGSLRSSRLADVPESEGIYVVMRTKHGRPRFRDSSSGGWFKGADPAVPVSALEGKWVPDAHVLYVGKASVNAVGRRGLRTRLREYTHYGAGKPVGHRGGRFIWQLEDAEALLVAWRRSDATSTAVADEIELLAEFKRRHGGLLPFANIAYPRR